MDAVYFQTDVLTRLLGLLPEESRLARLHQSLDSLSRGGLDVASVRTIELQICERLGLEVSDASERLPHVFVNYAKLGDLGIKLGFMSRRAAEDATRAKAERIRSRLIAQGCKVCGTIVEPDQNENFFWFRVEEREQPPTVRELLESYDDVIVR